MARLREAWCLLNLPCEGMARLASASLDRDLGFVERCALRTHALYCLACGRYLRQLRWIRRAFRAFKRDLEKDDVLPGPTLPEEARERIKHALKEN